jgi:sec-independent protein translocase protein TatB
LGPDKLPQTMVDIAKFIKSVKKTVGDAKNSLEEEMKIADLKDEALSYKKQLDDATSELKNFKNINFDDFDDVSYDDKVSTKSSKDDVNMNKVKETTEEETLATQVEPQNDTVTLKKKTKVKQKKNKEESDEKTDTPKDDA